MITFVIVALGLLDLVTFICLSFFIYFRTKSLSSEEMQHMIERRGWISCNAAASHYIFIATSLTVVAILFILISIPVFFFPASNQLLLQGANGAPSLSISDLLTAVQLSAYFFAVSILFLAIGFLATARVFLRMTKN